MSGPPAGKSYEVAWKSDPTHDDETVMNGAPKMALWVCPATQDGFTGGPPALGVHFFVNGDELPAPLFGEVFEFGVEGADQVEFLLAAPAFELLLAGD
jgi:hypothetical protein